MSKISKETIEKVKESLDIVDVISDYVQLKQAGNSYKGLCPFHDDKHPSMSVSRERNYFKCFSCSAGGDAITFVMNIEHIDYPEAIRKLAEKYGINVVEDKSYSIDFKEQERLSRLKSIMYEAMKYYCNNLSKNSKVLYYIKSRKINFQGVKNFFLGYSSFEYQDLYNYLSKKGFNKKDIVDTGLVIVKDDGSVYDRFRDRLMFPIFSEKKEVIGFGARALSEHNQPKYLNSNENDIFHKGKIVYGLHAYDKNFYNNTAILVEGYMDVLGLNIHGIPIGLAGLGTALTLEQAKLIRKYAKNIYVCYDGDEAGIKASLRAINIFKEIDVHPKFIMLPDNLDPDEYILKYGSSSFLQKLNEALLPDDFRLELVIKEYNENNNQLETFEHITDFLSDIETALNRDRYIMMISRKTGLNERSLKFDVERKVKLKINSNSRNKNILNTKIEDSTNLNENVVLEDISISLQFLSLLLELRENYILLDDLSDKIFNIDMTQESFFDSQIYKVIIDFYSNSDIRDLVNVSSNILSRLDDENLINRFEEIIKFGKSIFGKLYLSDNREMDHIENINLKAKEFRQKFERNYIKIRKDILKKELILSDDNNKRIEIFNELNSLNKQEQQLKDFNVGGANDHN